MRPHSPSTVRRQARAEWAAAAVTPLLAVALAGLALAGCAPGPSAALSGAAFGAWTKPQAIRGANGLDSLSCATPDFCVSLDTSGHSFIWDGRRWSRAIPVATSQCTRANPPSCADGNAVSCPAAGFCVAVDVDGAALVMRGRVWSPPVGFDTQGSPSDVSCATAELCVAVDDNGEASTFNGSSWSAATGTADDGQLMGVSCGEPGACMAFDATSYTEVLHGRRWRELGELSLSTPQGGSEPNSPTSVSCATATFCALVDAFGDFLTFNGRSWSGTRTFDDIQLGNAVVSCASPRYCMIVDSNGNAIAFDGRTLSSPVRVTSQSDPPQGIACPRPRSCMAITSDSFLRQSG